MLRSTAYIAAVLGGVSVGLAACPAQAQYLYVGFNNAQDFTTPGTAVLAATGTTVSGNYAFVNASPSTVNYQELATFNSSTLTISGGTFNALDAEGTSVINLLGTNLAESSGFHFSPIGDPYYTITGIMQGGSTPFTSNWYAPSSGVLEFNGVQAVRGANPVPEAATAVSLSLLLLLGAGWVTVAKRRCSY